MGAGESLIGIPSYCFRFQVSDRGGIPPFSEPLNIYQDNHTITGRNPRRHGKNDREYPFSSSYALDGEHLHHTPVVRDCQGIDPDATGMPGYCMGYDAREIQRTIGHGGQHIFGVILNHRIRAEYPSGCGKLFSSSQGVIYGS